jgi:hypothetical protein
LPFFLAAVGHATSVASFYPSRDPNKQSTSFHHYFVLYLCNQYTKKNAKQRRHSSASHPSGAGAIAIIRISGQEAITIGNSVFKSIKTKIY